MRIGGYKVHFDFKIGLRQESWQIFGNVYVGVYVKTLKKIYQNGFAILRVFTLGWGHFN